MDGTHRITNVISAAECQVKHCRPNKKCYYFVYIKNDKICYLKTKEALAELDHEEGVKFGPAHCNSK